MANEYDSSVPPPSTTTTVIIADGLPTERLDPSNSKPQTVPAYSPSEEDLRQVRGRLLVAQDQGRVGDTVGMIAETPAGRAQLKHIAQQFAQKEPYLWAKITVELERYGKPDTVGTSPAKSEGTTTTKPSVKPDSAAPPSVEDDEPTGRVGEKKHRYPSSSSNPPGSPCTPTHSPHSPHSSRTPRGGQRGGGLLTVTVTVVGGSIIAGTSSASAAPKGQKASTGVRVGVDQLVTGAGEIVSTRNVVSTGLYALPIVGRVLSGARVLESVVWIEAENFKSGGLSQDSRERLLWRTLGDATLSVLPLQRIPYAGPYLTGMVRATSSTVLGAGLTTQEMAVYHGPRYTDKVAEVASKYVEPIAEVASNAVDVMWNGDKIRREIYGEDGRMREVRVITRRPFGEDGEQVVWRAPQLPTNSRIRRNKVTETTVDVKYDGDKVTYDKPQVLYVPDDDVQPRVEQKPRVAAVIPKVMNKKEAAAEAERRRMFNLRFTDQYLVGAIQRGEISRETAAKLPSTLREGSIDGVIHWIELNKGTPTQKQLVS